MSNKRIPQEIRAMCEADKVKQNNNSTVKNKTKEDGEINKAS